MKRWALWRKIALLFYCFLIFSNCNRPDNTLKIAAAANTQFALKEIAKAFEEQTNEQVDLVFGASGALTAKIQQGAPYDVFISADLKYPDTLFKRGFSRQKPRVYAYGQLVLWSLKDFNLQEQGIDLLSNPRIKKIALANPKIAPYGKATLQSLKFFDLFDKLENKLIKANNVGQTNHFIISRSCDIGFTAMSAVKSPEMAKYTNWIPIPKKAHEPIQQGAIIVEQENQTASGVSKKFFNFLFSEKAGAIFKKYGYLIPNNSNI